MKSRLEYCTNAAGLGVHLLQVHNVVHYWVLKEFETFQQQIGRGWMDGWMETLT